ncbi:MAG: sulfatase-like hydrolase/transferase [Limisphaerales bacterium]
MNLRTLLLLLVTIGAVKSADKRPNILFIYTDDHSHRTISCYPEAYPFAKTPNIDALAKNGVRFKYAYIGTWCMPSRASLLTGHYQHGIESMRMVGKYPGSEYDPDKCPFWPKAFRANGYQTAQIGKWHTGMDTGFGRDWDYQIVWNRPRHPSNAGNYYKDQMIEFNGGKAKMVKGYTTDNYTKWAVEYLKGEKGRQKDKPWYLWVCYGAVHGPFTPAKRHLEAYPDLKIPVPKDIYPPRQGKPAWASAYNKWFKGEDGQPHKKGRKRATGEMAPGSGIHGSDLNAWVRQYHQGVRALDESVGTLVQTLKDTGQYDNTLIVFTSDQGFAWGQHGMQNKAAAYDAAIRSALIFSMPRSLPSGKVCNTPAVGPDLIPTFFDFAGIDLPWKMHGSSLTTQLAFPNAVHPRSVMMVNTQRIYGSDTDQIPTAEDKLYFSGGIPWWVSLHDGRYKYVRSMVENEIEELYDLQSDPEELNNLALAAAHGNRLKQMRAGTLAELKRTDAGFADKMPPVKTKFR